MKLRNWFELFGIRGKPKRYGYEVKTFNFDWLPFPVKYAQWQHPKEKPKSISMDEVNDYRTFLREGDFCIDIGAHSGDSVLPMAVAVGRAGMVLALEPNSYVFPMLEKTARLNREFLNICPVMAAAAHADGYMTFEYSDSGFCNGGRHDGMSRFQHGHAYQLDVVTINLAEELKQCYAKELPRLKFIKVDTEGFDYQVLSSLDEIIRQYRPSIKTEVFGGLNREQRERQIDFLIQRGYEIYKATDGAMRGEKITLTDAMKWSHYDVFGVPV